MNHTMQRMFSRNFWSRRYLIPLRAKCARNRWDLLAAILVRERRAIRQGGHLTRYAVRPVYRNGLHERLERQAAREYLDHYDPMRWQPVGL
jgi:hypothetical protein